MNKLLPCPFCGGEAHFERVGTNKVSCIVACEDCGASLETGETWDSGANWNTRAQLDEAVKVIEDYQTLLFEYKALAVSHIDTLKQLRAETIYKNPATATAITMENAAIFDRIRMLEARFEEAQAFIKGVRGCT